MLLPMRNSANLQSAPRGCSFSSRHHASRPFCHHSCTGQRQVHASSSKSSSDVCAALPAAVITKLESITRADLDRFQQSHLAQMIVSGKWATVAEAVQHDISLDTNGPFAQWPTAAAVFTISLYRHGMLTPLALEEMMETFSWATIINKDKTKPAVLGSCSTIEQETALDLAWTMSTGVLDYLGLPGPVSRWLPPVADMELKGASMLRFAGRCFAADAVEAMLQCKPYTISGSLAPGTAGMMAFVVNCSSFGSIDSSPLTVYVLRDVPQWLVIEFNNISAVQLQDSLCSYVLINPTFRDRHANHYVYVDQLLAIPCQVLELRKGSTEQLAGANSIDGDVAALVVGPGNVSPTPALLGSADSSTSAETRLQHDCVILENLLGDTVGWQEDVFGRCIAGALRGTMLRGRTNQLTAGCVMLDLDRGKHLPVWIIRW